MWWERDDFFTCLLWSFDIYREMKTRHADKRLVSMCHVSRNVRAPSHSQSAEHTVYSSNCTRAVSNHLPTLSNARVDSSEPDVETILSKCALTDAKWRGSGGAKSPVTGREKKISIFQEYQRKHLMCDNIRCNIRISPDSDQFCRHVTSFNVHIVTSTTMNSP